MSVQLRQVDEWLRLLPSGPLRSSLKSWSFAAHYGSGSTSNTLVYVPDDTIRAIREELRHLYERLGAATDSTR